VYQAIYQPSRPIFETQEASKERQSYSHMSCCLYNCTYFSMDPLLLAVNTFYRDPRRRVQSHTDTQEKQEEEEKPSQPILHQNVLEAIISAPTRAKFLVDTCSTCPTCVCLEPTWRLLDSCRTTFRFHGYIIKDFEFI